MHDDAPIRYDYDTHLTVKNEKQQNICLLPEIVDIKSGPHNAFIGHHNPPFRRGHTVNMLTDYWWSSQRKTNKISVTTDRLFNFSYYSPESSTHVFGLEQLYQCGEVFMLQCHHHHWNNNTTYTAHPPLHVSAPRLNRINIAYQALHFANDPSIADG